MRPHPLLAITSAIFILGAAGAIGDATITTQSQALTAARHRVVSEHRTVRTSTLIKRGAGRLGALVVGAYRTAPLPYLFATSSHPARRVAVKFLSFAAVPKVNTAASPSQWLSLRECESGDNYAEDTGNGYYGAYQFAPTTWWLLGYSGMPSQASPSTQDAAAARLQQVAGWSAWPVCSEVVGL